MAATLSSSLSSYAPWNWGENFEVGASQQWWSDHEEYPLLAIGIYLCIVHKGPAFMKKHPLSPAVSKALKVAFVVWNLGLSLFSWIGLYFAVPHLLRQLAGEGFYSTACSATNWYSQGKVAFWVHMFVFSKFPELFDTVFLVLNNKPVIFLHWYHHVTVLFFCWQAYVRDAAPGLWYCAMNYSVHAVMYLYYAGMAIPATRKLVRPLSMFITTAQIAQMVAGAAVTMSAAWWWAQGTGCHVRQSTCCLGVVMYVSYFYLFLSLFLDKYCAPKPAPAQEKLPTLLTSRGAQAEVCKADASKVKGA